MKANQKYSTTGQNYYKTNSLKQGDFKRADEAFNKKSGSLQISQEMWEQAHSNNLTVTVNLIPRKKESSE